MTIAAPAASATGPLSRRAIIHTTKGDIRIDLFPDQVPKTVENFVGLSKKSYYEGVIFHRVIPKFVSRARSVGFEKGRLRYPRADDPNRRPARRWHRWRIAVGLDVRGRVPPVLEARPAVHAQYGERGTKDERFAVLYHDRALSLVSLSSHSPRRLP